MNCRTLVVFTLTLLIFSFTLGASPKKPKKDKELKQGNFTIQKIAHRKKGTKKFIPYTGKEAEPLSLTGTALSTTSDSTGDEGVYIGVNILGEEQLLRFTSTDHLGGEVHVSGLTGDPDFTIVNNTCIYAETSCYTEVLYSPSTEGFKATTLIAGMYDSYKNLVFDLSHRWYGVALEEDFPPELRACFPGSIIKIDDRSLSEKVPVVGVPFDLYYSSEHSPNYKALYTNPVRVNHFNPEAWTISILHHYNSEEQNLFRGSGDFLKRVPLQSDNSNLLVVNGDEVYVFDQSGKHLETKSSLTGYTKYSFIYNSDNKIIKIKDAFGKETLFNRNGNGALESIVSPYGQLTTIGLDQQGRITAITNPNSETYQISYQEGEEAEDFISSFTKPSGLSSIFEFDQGKLVVDEGIGGNFWDIEYSNEDTAHKTEVYSSLDRKTTFITDRNKESGQYFRTQTSPSGFVSYYTEGDDKSQIQSNAFESSINQTQMDERFGEAMNRTSTHSETINGLIRYTEFLQSVTLSNPNDPFSYDRIQNTIKVNGVATTEIFEKAALTKTITDPMGIESRIQLDQFERPVSITLGQDVPLDVSYDEQGRVIQTSQGGKNSLSYTYDSKGNLQTETNALNQTTHYSYDEAGRPVQITLPNGRLIGMEYNPDGKITGITPPGRPKHSFSYNLLDLPQTYEPPLLTGQLTSHTTYSYNSDKQMTSINRPDGQSTAFAYDDITGLLMNMDDQTYTHHPNSDLIQSIHSPDGVTSDFTYFGLNRIASEKQTFGSQVTEVSFNYDNFFRPIQRILKVDSQVVSTVSTTYRPDGKPSLIGEMTLEYDEVSGRLITTNVEQTKDYRTYDAYGNLQSYRSVFISGTQEQLLYSYELGRDSLHRIVTKVETIQGETNSYEYSYDVAGRLSSVARNGMIISSYQYDSNGNRISGTMSGNSFTATYDVQDRLITFTDPQEASLSSSSFITTSSDSTGQKNKRGRGHGYGPCHNPSDEGPRHNGNNGRSQNGCDGGSDNGGSSGGTTGGSDGGSDGGTVGGADGGGSDGGGTSGGYGTYSYNDNGELTTISKESGTTTLSVDKLGRLKEVSLNNEKVISYILDWDGRRISRNLNGTVLVRRIYENDLQLAAEVDQVTGTLKEYVYGTHINSPDYLKIGADTYRIIKNHLGSPRLVVNASDGSIAQRMDYNEWGEVLQDSNPGFQAFGFAGGLYDPDTKLVKFGVRDYDSSSGRWISKDPIHFYGGDTNLYGYVVQDPINLIDTNGLFPASNIGQVLMPNIYDISKNPPKSIQSRIQEILRIGREQDKLSAEKARLLESKNQLDRQKLKLLNQRENELLDKVLDELNIFNDLKEPRKQCQI
jgi:RHS repeat-associated protein